MTATTSPVAYDDCYAIFDRALKAKRGVRIEVPTEGAGMQLYTRLHYARSLEREQNNKVFTDPDDPRRGVSEYDVLIVRKPKLDGDQWWVRIERRALAHKIEEIDDATTASRGAVDEGDTEPERVRRRLV